MQFNRRLDMQTRAIMMATGGAAIAAVTAMFVPVGLWEMLTGATGISEMIPATGAPLGDTARALISFAVGALAFAALSVVLLRRKASPKAEATVLATPIVDETAAEPLGADDEDVAERPSMVDRLKSRVSSFVDSRRSDADISALEDLPKLRSGDAHPDAPPRRPLLATRDLVDFEPRPTDASISMDAVVSNLPEPEIEPEPEIQIELHADPAVEQPSTEAAAPYRATPVPELSPASLAAMVDHLEQSLAERDVRLAQLEALVLEASAAQAQPLREALAGIEEVHTSQPAPPTLEAVPSVPPAAQSDEEAEAMDAALRSALETLHRMNARTR